MISNHRKSTQVHARSAQTESPVDPSFQLATTCESVWPGLYSLHCSNYTLSYGPARAFIAKLLRKSPYEGRTRWREQGRKKPSRPARIAYGPHTGILSIARARCELKQLCCYINPDFSVKKSDISEHYEFDHPKIKTKKARKKKKEKRCGHIIKCLLTELGLAGRENILLRSVRTPWTILHFDIFPSFPSHSVKKYTYWLPKWMAWYRWPYENALETKQMLAEIKKEKEKKKKERNFI